MRELLSRVSICLALVLFLSVDTVAAQQIYIDAAIYSDAESSVAVSTNTKRVELFPLVRSGSFTEDSVFEVPIAINTNGTNINTIDLRISFDPSVLAIVKPSSGNSILNLWIDAPTYNNTTGKVELAGLVRNGITTSSGVITTLTFRALKPGSARVEILRQSRVLFNDGLGTEATLEVVRGTYTVLPKPQGAVRVYSESHPVSSRWYNNHNPSVAWDPESGVTGYSYLLDDKPQTVPDNEIDTAAHSVSYQDVPNGISYFHIKSRKGSVWGEATHFPIRIDSEPPATFVPTVSEIRTGNLDQVQYAFFTTDELSGLDRYEVGVSDARNAQERPLFVQTESPYIAPRDADSRVVVRAFDQAGNARDVVVSDFAPGTLWGSIVNMLFLAIAVGFLLLLLFLVLHFVFAHHIVESGKVVLSKLRKTPEANLENTLEDTHTP